MGHEYALVKEAHEKMIKDFTCSVCKQVREWCERSSPESDVCELCHWETQEQD